MGKNRLAEAALAENTATEEVLAEGTHIKANANSKKQVKKSIPVAAKRYQEPLDTEIEAGRAAHGKKSLKRDKEDDPAVHPPVKQRTVSESATDPESGLFHKGEHKKCCACEAHTVCDRRGYVLETEVTLATSATALRLARSSSACRYRPSRQTQDTKRRGSASQSSTTEEPRPRPTRCA